MDAILIGDLRQLIPVRSIPFYKGIRNKHKLTAFMEKIKILSTYHSDKLS